MFRDYFAQLYRASADVIAGLGFPREAPSLEVLLGATRPELEKRGPEIVARFESLRGGLAARGDAGRAPRAGAAGLNTIGMLCDRLTVLAMKDWVLGHRTGSPADARQLRDTQVAELIEALGAIAPGHSSFTQKLTTLKVEAAASSWEETYFGLLSTNVLLWESQEVLYGGRIDRLPCEELRRYIAWFSEGNVRRNLFIAQCEPMFWRRVGEGR